MVKSSHGTLQHHHVSIISNNVYIQIKILGKKIYIIIISIANQNIVQTKYALFN